MVKKLKLNHRLDALEKSCCLTHVDVCTWPRGSHEHPRQLKVRHARGKEVRLREIFP